MSDQRAMIVIVSHPNQVRIISKDFLFNCVSIGTDMQVQVSY